MTRPIRLFLAALAIASVGCVSSPQQIRSSALDFLYPAETPAAAPAREVTLRLPARVGVGFAPPASGYWGRLSAEQRRALLETVADSFRERKSIGAVEVVPSSYLPPKGGFASVDRAARALGFDVLALVSFDQFQVNETTHASIGYWTLIGAYLIPGERSETHTLLEAAVYDVKSRVLLFHAAGSSRSREWATPVSLDRELRKAADEGFEEATAELIGGVQTALTAFGKQADTGTVRGRGTPAIRLVDDQGRPVKAGGALGLSHGVLAGTLAFGAFARGVRRRRKRRGPEPA